MLFPGLPSLLKSALVRSTPTSGSQQSYNLPVNEYKGSSTHS